MIWHVLATAGLALVAAGYLLRRRLKAHVACMASACLVDYGVLIGLELTRGPAIAAALGSPSPLLRFHIAVSVGAILCYPALIVLGTGAVGRRPHWLPWHRRVGRAFLALRAANYVTSWMVG